MFYLIPGVIYDLHLHFVKDIWCLPEIGYQAIGNNNANFTMNISPDNKVRGANMGSIWGRQEIWGSPWYSIT